MGKYNYELSKLNGKPTYIPEGFEHTEGTLEAGYVIKGTSDNEETNGNEFVWVPIETPVLDLSTKGDINDKKIKEEVQKQIDAEQYPMAVRMKGGNYIGVLYDFILDNEKVQVKIEPYNEWQPTSSNAGYREPDVITSDGDNITKENLQAEYNELVESVINNGGFYIGRYESGFGGTKAVSRENEPTANLADKTWDEMYWIQKNIYGEEEGKPKTNMIWGSQWDQVMIYLKDVLNENASEKKFFILDSTGMGNFEGSRVPTGTEPDYPVKEIFGLAGNVWDWTMEAFGTEHRVHRGGCWVSTDATTYPPEERSHGNLLEHRAWNGSRLTLYK